MGWRPGGSAPLARADGTLTDPRSQRTQASRRGGQIISRAHSSSDSSACPFHVLPTPLSWSTQDTVGAPRLPARRWRHRKSCLIIVVLDRTIRASRAASGACGASRTTKRLNAFTVSMANSAICSVLATVITRSSPPPSAAPASPKGRICARHHAGRLGGPGAVNLRPRLVAPEPREIRLASVPATLPYQSSARKQLGPLTAVVPSLLGRLPTITQPEVSIVIAVVSPTLPRYCAR
jgi:hypothetical protein